MTASGDGEDQAAASAALTLTAREALRIYEAGIERGNEEGIAYECGGQAPGHRLDKLEEAFCWSFDDSILHGDQDERMAAWEGIRKAIS